MTRILGIDPGSQRTGVGIVDSDATGRCVHVFHAPIVLLGADDFPKRLKILLDELGAIIEKYKPEEVAIEKVFMAKNPDSALKLGQARGAAMCAAVMRDLPGKGGADKVQVQHMVGVMLNLQGKLQADAADALGVALTHAHLRAALKRVGVTAQQLWRRK